MIQNEILLRSLADFARDSKSAYSKCWVFRTVPEVSDNRHCVTKRMESGTRESRPNSDLGSQVKTSKHVELFPRRSAAAGHLPNLEAPQKQIDGFLSKLPYKCHHTRVASVGDGLKICPQVTSRVVWDGSWEAVDLGFRV